MLEQFTTGGSVALGAGEDYVEISGAAFFSGTNTISLGADDDLVVDCPYRDEYRDAFNRLGKR